MTMRFHDSNSAISNVFVSSLILFGYIQGFIWPYFELEISALIED